MKAYVDVNFCITVRVPVDLADLPAGVEEGDNIESLISADLYNDIVSTACDVMDGPSGTDVDSIVINEIEEGDDPEDEDPDEIYNNSPEYIHDAAVDWMNEHADFLNDIGEDSFKERCMDDLREEGYNVDKFDYVIDEAFEDMDWEGLAADYDD